MALTVGLMMGVACGGPEKPSDGPVEGVQHPCSVDVKQVVKITGPQPSQYRKARSATGTAFDARTATWTAVDNWPVHIEGGSGLCWIGGRIDGGYSDTTTWEQLHHTGAFNLFSPRSRIYDLRVHNFGDGIRIVGDASEFTIRGAHLSFIRDDCIENDRLYEGTLEDSLLDGCYVALSARPFEGSPVPKGRRYTWKVQRSLIRLQPMPTVYRGPIPGHGGFFKWDEEGRGPKLTLRDNIFRADQNSNHTTMGIPPGALGECSNNIMVWLGPGAYPERLPSCFTVTTDPAAWDQAVAAWHLNHPDSP